MWIPEGLLRWTVDKLEKVPSQSCYAIVLADETMMGGGTGFFNLLDFRSHRCRGSADPHMLRKPWEPKKAWTLESFAEFSSPSCAAT